MFVCSLQNSWTNFSLYWLGAGFQQKRILYLGSRMSGNPENQFLRHFWPIWLKFSGNIPFHPNIIIEINFWILDFPDPASDFFRNPGISDLTVYLHVIHHFSSFQGGEFFFETRFVIWQIFFKFWKDFLKSYMKLIQMNVWKGCSPYQPRDSDFSS